MSRKPSAWPRIGSLKLHRQDLDTMCQAVVKCVMHSVRAALLVFDQGSKDAYEGPEKTLKLHFDPKRVRAESYCEA